MTGATVGTLPDINLDPNATHQQWANHVRGNLYAAGCTCPTPAIGFPTNLPPPPAVINIYIHHDQGCPLQ